MLSCGVAITGIAAPIGLSFLLQSMVGVSSLQAFAAGAALCSTSLGTTFTVLSASGLGTTRLGVVLTSAAMMDDVVGLVMVQVVSNLSAGDVQAATIVRPVLVSLAFATIVPLVCVFVFRPMSKCLDLKRQDPRGAWLDDILRTKEAAFAIPTLWLFGLVIAGTYAGTSSLLAAYISGATVSWWDSQGLPATSYSFCAHETA